MPFGFTRLKIPEVIMADAKAFYDSRGFFAETYKLSEFTANGISQRFVQDNFSHSVKGALRGLHYQKDPAAQAKLVSVARGEIFDVVVDIRKGSPSYGRWLSVVLSQENHRLLYVPRGFAHGFQVISEEADVIYKATAEYAPRLERGIRWDDPSLAIAWPIREPILSPKDIELPFLRLADNEFIYEGKKG